jgi:hypothetical protein
LKALELNIIKSFHHTEEVPKRENELVMGWFTLGLERDVG